MALRRGRRRRGRISPYLAVGRGGALTSVDLDNVSDQEIRHSWLRSGAAGVKVVATRGRIFVDVQVRVCRLSGSGPIVPLSGLRHRHRDTVGVARGSSVGSGRVRSAA